MIVIVQRLILIHTSRVSWITGYILSIIIRIADAEKFGRVFIFKNNWSIVKESIIQIRSFLLNWVLHLK